MTVWRQLKLDCAANDAPALELWLHEHGALAVTLEDAGDEPLLEPEPGTAPLWSQLRVTALFPDSTDMDRLSNALRTACRAEHRWDTLADRQWERVWEEDFAPRRFGRRLWIVPPAAEMPDPDAAVVRLEPGLAFGTGHHPTTALCLEWLDAARLSDRRILDIGSGSGVLAIAALKLGAAAATAVDIDPQAVTATRANARKNAVERRLDVPDAGAAPEGRFDIVLANILARPLIEMAPRLARHLVADGVVVLSGMLADQADEVARAFEPWFVMAQPATRAGWALLDGRRH